MAVQQLTAQHLFHHKASHIYRQDGKKERIDSLLSGDQKQIWSQGLSNEWGRLALGNDMGVQGTDTIEFIHQSEVP